MTTASPVAAWVEGMDPDCIYNVVTVRELVRPSMGFCVGGHDSVWTVKNVPVQKAKEEYCCSSGLFYFLLADGEFVKQVSYTVAENRATAIRFTTNTRVGRRRGAVKHLIAPYDGCINSLVCGEKSARGGASSIAAVIWRLASPFASGPTNTLQDVQDVCVLKTTEPAKSDDQAFHSATHDVKAVSICCDGDFCDVEVLSASEHTVLAGIQNDISFLPNDLVVQLLPNEHIVGVECRFSSGHRLLRIRLETTLRKTMWFGVSSLYHYATVVEAEFRCEPEKVICGFFASPIDFITFGVVVGTSPPPPATTS